MSTKGKSSAISATNKIDSERNDVKWKRHEFNDFLAENGVTSAMAKAVLELSRTEDRPVDPIEFIRKRMRPDNEDVRAIEMYRRKIEQLKLKTDKVRAERDRLLALKQRIQMIYDDECDSAEPLFRD